MADIAFLQVRAIARATLLSELRWKGSSSKRPSYRTFISMLFIYVFSGFAAALLTAHTDPFSRAFFLATFYMVLVANFMLLEFPTLVTGPEDYSFYAPLPVRPWVYFFGKVAAIFFILLCYALVFLAPVAILGYIRDGVSFPFPGIALAVVTAGINTALIVIVIFAFIVRFVPLRVLRTVASTVQFIIIFGVYGVFIGLRGFTFNAQAAFTVAFGPSILPLPSAWGSSLFALDAGLPAVSAFVFSFAAVPVLLFAVAKTITLDFAMTLSDLESRSTGVRHLSHDRGRLSGPLRLIWRTNEGKAMAMLLANHLRYDSQFRTGILMIVPMSLVYFILILVNSFSAIADPFTVEGVSSFMSTIPLYVVVGFFPFYIKNALSYSSFAEASWILYTASCDRVRLIDAAGTFIIIFFLVPYVCIFATVYAVVTGAILNIVLHFTVVFLLALIQLTMFLYFFAEMPFGKKGQKGKRTFTLYLRMLFAPLLPVPLYFFVRFFYGSINAFITLVAALLAVLFIVRFLGRKRAKKRLAKDEYAFG